MRAPLLALADIAERRLRSGGCELVSAGMIEEFKASYTMASEREVFDGVAAAEGQGGSAPGPAAAAAHPEAEIFSALAEASAQPPGPDGSDESVAAAANPGLGGNVELF